MEHPRPSFDAAVRVARRALAERVAAKAREELGAGKIADPTPTVTSTPCTIPRSLLHDLS